MGISIDKVFSAYKNVAAQKSESGKITPKETKGKHFDEIVISSNREEIEERILAENIAGDLAKTVNKDTDPEKLDRLQQLIAEGNYKIDADEIASKILLGRGESLNERV